MKNKIALITGGAQGIGKGMAKFFLEHKINVVILDNDQEAGNETINEFLQIGNINYVHANVSNEVEVIKAIESIIFQHGKLDYLINNAGIIIRKPIEELSLNEWNQVIGVNLTGAFLCTKYAAP